MKPNDPSASAVDATAPLSSGEPAAAAAADAAASAPADQPLVVNDTPVPADPGAFERLGLHPRLCAAVTGLGYEEPTPIQRAAIPPLLEGRDVLGQAATGTGKTAAFALPLLQRLSPDAPPSRPGALVLVPTRELAMQVAEAMHRYGRELGVRVLPIYGGQAISQQLRALRRGVDVVVATPGRALDHLRRGTLSFDRVGTLVLDEADEMLDLGFADDLEALLEATPKTRQTALFSATMPPRIASISHKHLREPARIQIAPEVKSGELPRVRQVAYVVMRPHKLAALGRVLDMETPTSAIVFCRTRTEVDHLTESLNGRGYRAEALHGGLSQEQRDRVVNRLRAGTAELLIATDVAARGLDIPSLSHVVNFDLPSSPEVYVHRIGRTGRAGREGVAISLCDPRESGLVRNIERVTRRKLELHRVPTVADLRARRLELTRASLREAIEAGGLERFRGLVESLSTELDVLDVAAAAVKLVHETHAAEGDEEDIPAPPVPRPRDRGERPERGGRFERGPARGPDRGGRDFGFRPGFGRDEGGPALGGGEGPRGRAERPSAGPATGRERRFAGRGAEAPQGARPSAPEGPRGERPAAPEGPRGERPAAPEAHRAEPPAGAGAPSGERPAGTRPPKRGPRQGQWDTVRLHLGAGRDTGLRAADLVGAMTNELGLSPRAIGTIEIGDGYTLVEVPAEIADDLATALRQTRIKGRTMTVRRHKER